MLTKTSGGEFTAGLTAKNSFSPPRRFLQKYRLLLEIYCPKGKFSSLVLLALTVGVRPKFKEKQPKKGQVMAKNYLTLLLLVYVASFGTVCFAQDSYVDSAVFSARHEQYLDEHPEFAELILDIYNKNKVRTDSYVKKAMNVYTKLSEIALKKGLLHHAEMFRELRDSQFHVYGYFTFPFVRSNRTDLFFCYFAPREAETNRNAYMSFRWNLPYSLVKDTDVLAKNYRQNALRLVKNIEWEKNRHAKALDESTARLAISFRNINVLEESVKYLKSKKIENQ